MKPGRSETYDRFLAIEPGAYKDQIRYIEDHFFKLRELEIDEYFDMLVLYGNALFESGEYARHVKLSDHILELAIERNIVNHREQDVYFETLFRKAASLHNIDRIDEAIYVLKELIKINPEHESTKLFLINCYIRQKKSIVKPYRFASVVLLLSSAFVICIELLIIKRVWPAWAHLTEIVRNGLFIIGVILLIAGEVLVRYKAVEDVFSFSKATRQRKESVKH